MHCSLYPQQLCFSPRTFPAKLTFIKDAEGKVTSVKLTQNGRETVGKKIK